VSLDPVVGLRWRVMQVQAFQFTTKVQLSNGVAARVIAFNREPEGVFDFVVAGNGHLPPL